MVGAASISAFPLFSGFVSKSMIVSSASHERLAVVWLILQFASAGVFHHAGIKVPFFTFFGHDSGIRTKEPPFNMLLAMGIAAFLCVAIAVFPKPLYAILPYPVHYVPYTGAHVVGQLQLLMFGALAFCLLILSGYYPPELRAINLDTDWFYRKGGLVFYNVMDRGLNGINAIAYRVFAEIVPERLQEISRKPLTLLVSMYVLAVEDVKRGTRPEEANLIPMGVPVLISIVFLFALFVVFISLA
jgi:multicomponent Na+:H+ antiporter subunit D